MLPASLNLSFLNYNFTNNDIHISIKHFISINNLTQKIPSSRIKETFFSEENYLSVSKYSFTIFKSNFLSGRKDSLNPCNTAPSSFTRIARKANTFLILNYIHSAG